MNVAGVKAHNLQLKPIRSEPPTKNVNGLGGDGANGYRKL